jgi:hypothetical protein
VSELTDEVREKKGVEMGDASKVLTFILCTVNPGRPLDRRFTMHRQDGLQMGQMHRTNLAHSKIRHPKILNIFTFLFVVNIKIIVETLYLTNIKMMIFWK